MTTSQPTSQQQHLLVTSAAVDDLQQRVDALAALDAASGAWDLAAVESLAGPFPREREIDLLTARTHAELRRSVEVGAAGPAREEQPLPMTTTTTSAVAASQAHAHPASPAPVAQTATAELERSTQRVADRSAEQLQQQRAVADLEAAVLREQERRDHAGRVLRGEADEHGTRWTGHEPSEPVSRHPLLLAIRVHRMRSFFVTLGMTLLALGVEWWIIKETLKQQVRSDSTLVGLVYAAPAVLIVTVVPHVLGAVLATQVRRERWERRAVLVFWLLVVAWLLPVSFLADLRARTSMDSARAARQQAELFGDGALPELPDQVLLFGQWFAILVGVGVALIAVKWCFYNPVLEVALRTDAVLAQLRPRLSAAEAELVRREQLLATARAEQQAAAARWRTAEELQEQESRAASAHRITQLEATLAIPAVEPPAPSTTAGQDDDTAAAARAADAAAVDRLLDGLGTELKQRYRNGLITALADPALTTAIATVPDDDVPSWLSAPEARSAL